MEALIKKAANKIAISQNYDEEREAVIAYGMLAIVQMFAILILSLTVGIIIHAVLECLIIYTAVGLLRKFTGGAHAGTMGMCILVSLTTITLMAFVAKYILTTYVNSYSIILSFIAYGVVFLMVGMNAPVDNPNKPIRNPQKIKRLRMQSLLFLSFSIVISSILVIMANYFNTPFLYSLHFSLTLALIWQSLTLTSVAEKITSFVNK